MQSKSFWVGQLRPKHIQTIVSTVPSQTELLFYLGANVIGLTHFCVHPKQWHSSKERIGGTKNLNVEKIQELQPDLIIANKEENTKEQIEELAQYFPVFVTDTASVEDALDTIIDLGLLLTKEEEAFLLSQQIEATFQELNNIKRYKVCYLIWKEPYMSVGGDTFISDVLLKSSFINVLSNEKRYPVVTIEQLKELDLDLLFLSSEPYPFKVKHLNELQLLLPSVRILLVDGELFSWYGSRLLKTVEYVKQLHQELKS